MKTLNLTSLEQSDIKYKVQHFPDGQKNIVIDPNQLIKGKLGTLLSFDMISIEIRSRLNNMEDFGLIACAVACLRELGAPEIHLYTPYFMGARSDRKFEEGGNWYLRDVICPMINALNFKSVTVLDAHSYVLGNLIKGFKSVSNEQLVKWALHRMPFEYKTISDHKILVSPDAGASHKIHKLAEAIGYKGKIYTATKERDNKGVLSNQQIANFSNDRFINQDKDVIIIDDICDGGATFVNLGKIIKNQRHQYCKGKTYLIVTHGIFSKGLVELSEYFDGIYCTNSYKDVEDWVDEKGKIFVKGDFVKQLNVF